MSTPPTTIGHGMGRRRTPPPPPLLLLLRILVQQRDIVRHYATEEMNHSRSVGASCSTRSEAAQLCGAPQKFRRRRRTKRSRIGSTSPAGRGPPSVVALPRCTFREEDPFGTDGSAAEGLFLLLSLRTGRDVVWTYRTRGTASQGHGTRLLRCLLAVHAILHMLPCSGWHLSWPFRQHPTLQWKPLSDELAVDARKQDDYFMRLAIEQAIRAGRRDEVPIGSIVVQTKAEEGGGGGATSFLYYRILGHGHNQVEQLKDASAHAELMALRQAGRNLNNWRLSNPKDDTVTTTLYSTCEPCLSCWANCHSFRIQRLVYGADDLRLGAITAFGMMPPCEMEDKAGDDIAGHGQQSAKPPVVHPFHNLSEIRGGVHQLECAELLRGFFRKRRQRPPTKTSSARRRDPGATTSRISRLLQRLRWRER